MVTLEDVMRKNEQQTVALLSAIMASAVFQKTDIGDKDPKAEFVTIFDACHTYLKEA